MKNNIKELDVDIIGGLGELTNEESKFLSEYFAKRKVEKANVNGKKVRTKQSLRPNKKATTD